MQMRFKKNNINESRHTKLITLTHPKSPVSEAFRTLRTNIQFASIDKTLRTIMVTSTGPGEGKSTTMANLAIVLAQQEKRVLLIDADLRKPTVHHTFRLPNRIGLTSVLAGVEPLANAIQNTGIEHLEVITSGPIPPNPAEIIGSKKMASLVEEISPAYDYVLFDAPPVLAVTDAQILSGLMDGVILVIHSGKTHREMALKAKHLLENVKANVIGVIMNHKDQKENGYYYYYYGSK